MELIACRCEVGFGLPHDHNMGAAVVDGVYQTVRDPTDVGHVWIDWKAFAKAVLCADTDVVPA